MNINKRGQWKSNNFSDIQYRQIVSPIIITEPDGSIWLQIMHHNDPADGLFASTDTFSIGVYKDANRWAQFNAFDCFTKWEIMIKQKGLSTDTESKFRWIQTVNPNVATYEQTTSANVTKITTAGYTSSSYGGMYYNGGSSSKLVCNNGKSGNWFGACGCWTAFNGGIPGYNAVTVKSGYLDVYIRIDKDSITSANLIKLFNTGNTVARDFIEI